MRKLLMLVLFIIWAVPASEILSPVEAFAQVDTAWVRRYNGPGNSTDEAYAIAVDGSGNVYVTGYSYGSGTYDDYATIKYDPNGNQLWVKRYNGPGNYRDTPHAIVVDGSGNVYVTGNSAASATPYDADYATIKYNPNGNQVWVKRYNGPGNFLDASMAIATDVSGNVCVTGGSAPSTTDTGDYATIKYDPNGNQLWVKRYNGLGNHCDAALAIVVDGSGNVYVTGYSYGSGTDDDYATIKYDPNGNQLWVKRYNGPGNFQDWAYDIALDASGNVYVTGRSASGDSGDTWSDYATIKYDASGNQVWVKRYNGTGNGLDGARAIVVDNSSNIYVTGFSAGSGTDEDYATIKYDASGNQEWVRRYSGPGNSLNFALDIAVDGSGNVYVTGYSYGSGTYDDYATIKYDPNGNQLWVKRYNGPANGSDEATAIAVDGSGNVYVTGGSTGSGTSCDYATIKYEEGDLYISDVKPIQVVWDPSAFVVDKKTMVKIVVQNTFPSSKYAKFRITYNYGQNTYIENGPGGNGVLLLPGENEVYLPGGATIGSQTAWRIGDELKWTSAGTETNLQVEVDPYNNVTEINESNNIITASPLTFQESKLLKIGYYRVFPSDVCGLIYSQPEWQSYTNTCVNSSFFMQNIWPIKENGIQSSYRDGAMYGGCVPGISLAMDLATLQLYSWLAGTDRGVGIVTKGYFDINLPASGKVGASLLCFTSSLVQVDYWTGPAHEIHHNLPSDDDWCQGNEEYDEKLCSDSWTVCHDNSECPPPQSCFSVNGRPAGGIRMWNHKLVKAGISDADGYCFMGYGSEGSFDNYAGACIHVCDRCYDHLLEGLKKDAPWKLLPESTVFVSGLVFRDGTAKLEDAYIIGEREVSYPDTAIGDYTIALLDAGEQTIMDAHFDLGFQVRGDSGVIIDIDADGFAFVLPWSAQVHKIRLMNNRSVLAEKEVSPNTPSVTVLQPNGGGSITIGDTALIAWTGQDIDGDSLHYAILFTSDNGGNWTTLAAGLTDSAFHFDSNHFPASESCKVKVVATDGVNTSMDESDSVFTLTYGFVYGDANGDGIINLGDVVYLITYLYKDGPAPIPLLAGDVNCDGLVALGDVVYLITYLYKGGPPPPC
jgi:hypothetical protein